MGLILTDICNRYDKPVVSANLGTSDHGSVFWRPKPSRDITVRAHKAQKRSVRRFPESAINAFGRWVSSHHWFTSLDSVASVDSLTESFNTDVKTEIDIHFPLKSVKIHPTYRPWMTSRIKQFILERRRAFYSDRNGRWRELRTRVRDEIAARKKAFYSEKLSYLKKCASAISYEVDNKVLSCLELANGPNNFFVSVTSDVPVLDYLTLPAFLPAPEELPVIRPTEVYKKLLRLSPFKACGPDAIPNRILKLFASELSEPVTTIFNRLLSSGNFPSAWRDAYILPIPKASAVTCDNDLRPVALTACLSKVFEDFVVQWLMEELFSQRRVNHLLSI